MREKKRREAGGRHLPAVFCLSAALIVSCLPAAQAAAATESAARETIMVFPEEPYQTIEDFGASGCWWSQDVGGWTEPLSQEADAPEVREYVAGLLFSREDGIGLTSYRYNVGAGSRENGNSRCITDPWRSTECFETAPGVYDWEKDANAVWFLQKAGELGVSRVTFFANSPLERLTVSGNAYGSAGARSNLDPSRYEEFSRYLLDVAEHFAAEGIPVTSISPVNEPQWDWVDAGQEGCHFEPKELAAFYRVFQKELAARETLSGVELEGPELGEWGNTSYLYMNTLKKDEELMAGLPSWSVHSYWSDRKAKESFMNWQNINSLDLKLRMSEWCEMVNGRDVTMDSALTLAEQVWEDLTIQNVVSWQYWIAVSCYDYRDGLIYVDTKTHKVTPAKRLWALGNYSRFVRPGFVRVACELSGDGREVAAFLGTEEDGERLVLVIVNRGEDMELDLAELMEDGAWQEGELWVTDEAHDLERTQVWSISDGESARMVTVPAESVTTVVLK